MPFFSVFNPLQLAVDAARGPNDTPPGSPGRGAPGVGAGRPEYAIYPPIVRQLAALWMYKANIRGAQDARQVLVQRQLAALREGLLAQEIPERTVDRVKTYVSGAHGIAYLANNRVGFFQSDEALSSSKFCTVFSGDLSRMRNIGVLDIMAHVHKTEDEERVAIRYQAALTVYNTFGKTMAQCSPFAKTRLVADEIKKLQGAYAFVLYDEKYRRIVAARDPEGIEPLYWGTCKDGTGLMFSTDRLVMNEECKLPKEFPAGGLYISNDNSLQGTLNGKDIQNPYNLFPSPSKNKMANRSGPRSSMVETSSPSPSRLNPSRREPSKSFHSGTSSTAPGIANLINKEKAKAGGAMAPIASAENLQEIASKKLLEESPFSAPMSFY